MAATGGPSVRKKSAKITIVYAAAPEAREKFEPKSQWYRAATGFGSVRKRTGKITIVLAAVPQEVENARNPVILKKLL